MLFTTVNLLAILVAAIVCMLFGAIWYSQIFFGSTWSRLSGAEMQGSKLSYFIMFLAYIVLSYVMAVFMKSLGIYTLLGALMIGCIVWLGFLATTSLGMVLWDKKPLSLYILNNAYHLLAMILIALVIVLWPRVGI